jgi:L-ascorbate metabolism protein UlaG (beta-lactamase superfamily)
MTTVTVTHIGGPTVLIEVAGWRLLTDPTFDPAGRRYAFGWGTSSRKLVGPAVSRDALGPVDAVLLTHDHHGDNLDDAGRQLLPAAGTVVTTVSAAARLGGVRFPVTGPLRYSMTARDAVGLLSELRPRIAVPVHYEGWKHFQEPRTVIERAFGNAPDDVRDRVRWLPLGAPTDLET